MSSSIPVFRRAAEALGARSLAALIFVASTALSAQPPAPVLTSIPAIPLDSSGPVLRARVQPQKPFTVAGERGVLLGQQDGTFEAWVLPVKVLSDFRIEANVQGYPVPIDVNAQSAEIEVRPDRTIITYSHIAFTLRQIMFSPSHAAPGTGPVVLFQFDCLHPTEFTFRFTPELRWMWPERNDGIPGIEWVSGTPAPGTPLSESSSSGRGYYVLHSDYPDLAAAVALPGAEPGILAPYQERPQIHPVEFKLHIDPAHDRGRFFPLLMALGTSAATATDAALDASLAQLDTAIPALYAAHAESYRNRLAHSVSIQTPNRALDEAFQWAEISIEQLKAHPFHPDAVVKGTASSPHDSSDPANATSDSPGETALVAGYYESGDSARPGFGWFFGRDALYTLYAVNGYGDFALSRDELEFLIRRQRADGKIMHEYSQTAPNVDWLAFPYMYAAADATPLFLLAVEDYVRSSGDTAFLNTHRDAIEKAWAFETDPTHDTDHDGIYDNSQGTGWVESWPGGMPHQEIYLALLDQQASAAMAQLESLLHDSAKSASAAQRADAIAKTIEREYYDPEKSCYAFSRNIAKDGTPSLDRTRTVYPAIAWWSTLPGTSLPGGAGSILAHPGPCTRQFAAATLNTDWGLRDVANDEPIYDGMSYHQGSVWPLFTGWAALAEYRAGQPLAGYRMLMQNANLTRLEDLGADTELLSGDFYVPMGRSTSHQLWSSAMVVTPTLRGLFGIDINALTKTITVNPHLPASWDHAEVLNLQVPGGTTGLYFKRTTDHIEVYLSPADGDGWHLRSDLPGATFGPLDAGPLPKNLRLPPQRGMRIPLPAVEIDEAPWPFSDVATEDASQMNKPPLPGARTAKLHILHEQFTAHQVTLTAEGLAGSDGILSVMRRGHLLPEVHTDPPSDPAAAKPLASLSYQGCDADPYACKWIPLTLHFPDGEGWKTITVRLTW